MIGKQEPPSDTAEAKQEWDGFRPVPYWLNWKVIGEIPINVIREPTDGGDDSSTPTTVGEAFVDLRDKQLEADSLSAGVTVKTDSGSARFSGSPFAKSLLYVLLRLYKEGVNPGAATWFFYDKDTSQDEVTCYTFFLVCDGRIAVESVGILHDPNDFNPAIFEEPPVQGPDRPWHSYKYQAETVFWYRKFYTETKAGQLMLSRSDQPTTYFFYPEDKQRLAFLQTLERPLPKSNALSVAFVILAFLALIVGLIVRLWR